VARADMSRSKTIPPGVRQFLLAHIDSVPALETLLIMRSDGRPDWTAEEIATRTYLDTSQALGVLATLVRAGLVSHQSSEGKYRLSLKDEAQRALLDEVANAYKTHLIQMATLIHGKPPSAVNEFARAFELKKDR
jgi:DNA-binding MarR family transcriptional regulator